MIAAPCGFRLRRCRRAAGVGLVALGSLLGIGQSETDWWLTPRRLIQTNLREIDAGMDLDAYTAALKASGANVVLFNVGGIVANYPTALPFHYRNPHATGDFAGRVVARLQAEGLRVIARFDFSKVHESLARAHPDWLTRDAQGLPLPPYNGQVPTCLNGWYQQEGMLQILGEVLDRYPVDGVFFNMIGYPRSDYSGRPVGVCQCTGCGRRFHELTGLALPAGDQGDTEAARRYAEFRRRTIADQFDKVCRFVKSRNPAVAICTYTEAGVDVIRKESNSPLDTWMYAESFRTRQTLLENPGKQLANAAVHFPDYPHRLASVAPELTRKRLFQCLVNGGWLDFYCIGPLHAQEDRLGLDEVATVLRFHAVNEPWLTDTVPVPEVGLAVGAGEDDAEVRGLVRLLAQAQVSYDLVSLARSDLRPLPALLVPVAAPLGASEREKLDAYVAAGGRLLLTGGPVTQELQCLGLRAAPAALRREKGTYLRIRPEDKARLKVPVFAKLDLLALHTELWPAETAEPAGGLLRYIPPAMFGPPEKCYYTTVSDTPGLHLAETGGGSVAWIPWRVGEHFDTSGHAGYAALVLGTLDHLLARPRRLRVEAPTLVEVNRRADRRGRFEWVSLYNHSGQSDRMLGAPIPVRDVRLHLSPLAPVARARSLRTGAPVAFTAAPDGGVTCTLPVLNDFDLVLFEY